MSLKYTMPENKAFSSWIVSGKEADFILKCLNSKHDKKISERNMNRTRKAMEGK